MAGASAAGGGGNRIEYSVSVDNTDALKGMSQFSGSAVQSAGLIGSAFKKIGPALALATAAIAGAAAINGVKKSVEVYRNFEKQLANVSTLVDTNVVSMDKLKNQILDLPSALGSATKNTEALYQAISAGIDPNAAVAFVAESAKAAKAGLVETLTAVEGGTTILNSFGLEAGNVTKVFDKMFVAVKDGKTTFGELSSTIGKVAPIASSAGISIDEMLGSVAALTTQGIKTSEAVTALKATFTNIIKPSSQAKEEAEKLGIQFDTAGLRAKGFAGFLQDVKDKTGGNLDSMGKLFGSVEALNGVLALTSEQGGKKFVQILDDMKKSTGETETAFQKQAKTYDNAAESLKNSFEKVGISIGARVAPELVKAADAISAWLDQSRQMENSGLNQFIDLVVNTFKTFLSIMDKLTPLWKTFGLLIGTVMTALDTLMTILKPFLVVLGGIAKVVSGVLNVALIALDGILQALLLPFKAIGKLIEWMTFGIVSFGDSSEKSFGKTETGATKALTATQKLNQEISKNVGLFDSQGKKAKGAMEVFGTNLNIEGINAAISAINKLKAIEKRGMLWSDELKAQEKIYEDLSKQLGISARDVQINIEDHKKFLESTTEGYDRLQEKLISLRDEQRKLGAQSTETGKKIKESLGTSEYEKLEKAVSKTSAAVINYNKITEQSIQNVSGGSGSFTKAQQKIYNDWYQKFLPDWIAKVKQELARAGVQIPVGFKLKTAYDVEKLLDHLNNAKFEMKDAVVNFKGTGSTELPLSEKIVEMEEKLKNFGLATDQVNPEVTVGFMGKDGKPLTESVDESKSKFQELIGEIGSDSLSTAMNTAERGFNGMFDSIMDGTFNVKSSFQDMIADILRSVAKMLASQAIKSLISMLGSSIGGSGGFSLQGFAEGGTLTPNKPVLVGERGPEIFKPRGAGSIIPNNQLGGGNSINITNNVSVGSSGGGGNPDEDRKQANDIARAINEKVKMQIAEQMRPGGILNPTRRVALGAAR